MFEAGAVTVVGGGVIGLTAALRLAEAGWPVAVVARAYSPDTTSDVAAAVWYPFRAGPPDAVARWARRGYAVLRDLAARAPAAGVRMVDGVELGHGPLPDEAWHADVDGLRRLAPPDVPAPFAHGLAFRAPVVAMPAYLAWLRARAAAAGARFATAEVTPRDLAAALDRGAVVVNATGLGARTLVGDDGLYPIRGQIVRVAPGRVARFVQATQPPQPVTYIIPRPDCTVLGGTAQVGRDDLAVDADTAAAIVARCAAIEPALAGAAVLSHAVGLRPGRDAVRLAAEAVGRGRLVHCYGHGGAGVTLSWGCADDVVALVGAP